MITARLGDLTVGRVDTDSTTMSSGPVGSLSRRVLVHGASAVLVGAATAGLAACSSTSPPSTGSESATQGDRPANDGRVLVAYFSRAGENYWNGGRRFLETGNTAILAGLIRDRIDCDVFRIEADNPYSDRYDPTVERNSAEQDRDARPRLAGDVPDVSGYDTVLLGSPIWNVQPPMIMATFVEAVDLAGRRLLPFVTYAVSGLGSTQSFYRGLGSGGRLGAGLAIRGEEVRSRGVGVEVERWLRTSDLA